MNDYIKRSAVHDLVKSLPKYQMFNYERTKSLTGISPDDVDFGVDKIPAADVVEVVRCRECECANACHPYPGVLYCKLSGDPTPYDGFCHRGKKSNP